MEKKFFTVKRTKEVDTSNLVALINSDAYYGTLDEIKEVIADLLSNGEEIENITLGTFDYIRNIVIDYQPTVDVDDDEGDLEREKFVIYDSDGFKIDEYYSLDEAIARLEELAAEQGKDEIETYSLDRETAYKMGFSFKKGEVTIDIPKQDMMVYIKPQDLVDAIYNSSLEEFTMEQLMTMKAAIKKRLNKIAEKPTEAIHEVFDEVNKEDDESIKTAFYRLLGNQTVDEDKAHVTFNKNSIDVMDILEDGSSGYGHTFYNASNAISYLNAIGALEKN